MKKPTVFRVGFWLLFNCKFCGVGSYEKITVLVLKTHLFGKYILSCRQFPVVAFEAVSESEILSVRNCV